MDTSWRRNYLRYKSFFLNMLTQYHERSDWKAYLEILLSLATVSLFSIFALRPTILTIAELIRQIEEKKATVAEMDAKIQSLSKAQSLYDRQRSNISLLTSSVVPDRAISDIFARQIEGLTQRHNLSLSRLTLGSAVLVGAPIKEETPKNDTGDKPVEPGQKYDFSLTIRAVVQQYSDIDAFIKDFENIRTPAKIHDITLSVKEADEDKKTKFLNVLIQGKLPYLLINNNQNQK